MLQIKIDILARYIKQQLFSVINDLTFRRYGTCPDARTVLRRIFMYIHGPDLGMCVCVCV